MGSSGTGSRVKILTVVAMLTASLGMAASSGAVAAEKGLSNKGEMLVRKNCSPCHAIGREGDSANPEAPPFRTLSSQYPVDDLAESLAEGIVSGHPDMPIFIFKPHDVDAIIAYLDSIQEAPAKMDGDKDPEDGGASAEE